MSESDVFFKTAAGAEALKQRLSDLPARLRPMLIMVDGVRTVAQLRQAAATLAAPEDFLTVLQQQGLVGLPSAPAAAPAPAIETALPKSGAERFLGAQRYMNDTAVDGMGFRAFFFCLKLEKCFNADDLCALLPEFAKHMTKARGEVFAQAASDRVRRLLS